MVAKSIRKNVSFDDSDGDRALLDAIAAHQGEHEQSFSELCKQALHQYLLSREPTQSVVLFMELQQQIAQLGARVATLENAASSSDSHVLAPEQEAVVEAEAVADDEEENTDPVLSRLGPLLDDF